MRNYILMGDSDNAWHNLAVEALLFETLGESDRVLYLWQNRNTVVIGRHQNAWKECRVKLLEDEGGTPGPAQQRRRRGVPRPGQPELQLRAAQIGIRRAPPA